MSHVLARPSFRLLPALLLLGTVLAVSACIPPPGRGGGPARVVPVAAPIAVAKVAPVARVATPRVVAVPH